MGKPRIDHLLVFLAASAALGGCENSAMNDTRLGGWLSNVTLSQGVANAAPPSGAATGGAFSQAAKPEKASKIISDLQRRASILPNGSPQKEIVSAIVSASSRAAEADLRAANLRAKAQSQNWLPRIGPNISLTNLGDLVAGIVFEQVLFDNGRKRAEREMAKADVEVAAVTLSADMNDRAFTALELYATAEEARRSAEISRIALLEMASFRKILVGRMEGGMGVASDVHVLDGKIKQLQTEEAREKDRIKISHAELASMAPTLLDNLRGLSAVPLAESTDPMLSVVLARAEKLRGIATGDAERGTILPSVQVTGGLDNNGSNGALGVGVGNLLGLGTGAQLRSVEASKQAFELREGEAIEDAQRREVNLRNKIISLNSQISLTRTSVAQTQSNYNLFREEFFSGGRPLLDVVGVFEDLTRQQKELARVQHLEALARHDLAREYGFLVDGKMI